MCNRSYRSFIRLVARPNWVKVSSLSATTVARGWAWRIGAGSPSDTERDAFGARREYVAEADVDLQRDAGAFEGCRQPDADATVARVLADHRRTYAVDIELQPVGRDRHGARVPEDLGDIVRVIAAQAQEA